MQFIQVFQENKYSTADMEVLKAQSIFVLNTLGVNQQAHTSSTVSLLMLILKSVALKQKLSILSFYI